MMGERRVMQEALFYSFNLERHVPKDDLLRKIDRFVDLSEVRAHLDGVTPALVDGLGLRRACLGHRVSFRIRWAKDSPGPSGGVRDCRSFFDELKDGHPRLAVRSEATPIDQLAFEGGEETLAHRIVVGVADRGPVDGPERIRLLCSERRKRPTCIARTGDPMMDDVVGLSGHERPVEKRRARRGSSDRPRRPIRRSGATRRRERPQGRESRPTWGRKVISATHNSFGRSAMKLRRTQDRSRDDAACRLSRRDRRASAPADARNPCRFLHQPSNPLPANREAIGRFQLGVNTRRAIGSMRSSVDSCRI